MAAGRHKRPPLLLFLLVSACGAADDASLASSAAAVAGLSGGGSSSSGGSPAPCKRQLQSAAGQPYLEEPGRAVVLYTTFGPVRIRLLERLAPRVTALVWSLALVRGCSNAYKCAFYRVEARPRPELGQDPLGPPYALLQGRMHDLAEDPPFEGNVPVRRGHACFIPGGKDWFVAMGDHPEWGTSHAVWGVVDEWRTADIIISQQYNPWTNPDSNITLRILRIEVPFVMAVDGDKTFEGPIT
ncbi:hypothetical protein ABPG75_000277 [Micractinium tetrahymenae]